jgi:hypothetical protein
MRELIKNFNWKALLKVLLIIYIVLWSYWYLAIMYGEHRQKTMERIKNVCQINFSGDSDKCRDIFYEKTIRTFFIFKPLLVRD